MQRSHVSLYSQFYTPAELAMLDAAPFDDLASEFKLIRVLIRRLLLACQRRRSIKQDLELAVLRAVAGACRTLCRIARFQPRLLRGKPELPPPGWAGEPWP